MNGFRLLLMPLTLVYGTLIALRRILYRVGVFSSSSVRTPSISMGGLHVGGLGKTPLSFHVLERLQSHGLKPAFLSRGYGRTTEGVLVRRPGEALDARRFGDEPTMLGERMPELALAVAENRCLGATKLEQTFSPDCIVLDDAFSHLAFQASLDCIVLPADPLCWFETLQMPTGTMREGWSARGMAEHTLYWFHARHGLASVSQLHPRVRGIWNSIDSGKRILTGTSLRVMDIWGASDVAPGPIFLSAGIARPDGFSRSVCELGWEVRGHRWHRDHVVWTETLFADALSEAKKSNASLGITLKDAVKLRDLRHLVEGIEVVVFEPQIAWVEGENYFDEVLRCVVSNQSASIGQGLSKTP